MKDKRKRRTSSDTKKLKNETVRMRVSPEHKQAMTSAAERDGLDLSAWLRRVALKAAGALPEAE
jgi:uncharacterized protein (DUF1778 family)